MEISTIIDQGGDYTKISKAYENNNIATLLIN
jgi:hypothetical protein